MPTTHQRVNTYMNNSAVNTVYTNSSGTRQRIILTDMHFAADTNYYSSDMGSINFFVIKRCDNISSAMTHTIFYGSQQYVYSIYANWSSSVGAGGVLSGINTSGQSGIGQVGHYASTYSNTPWTNMSYQQSFYFGDGGQSSARGLGQCILYPGDTLRIGVNKYGTAYIDFLVITE